MKRSRLWLAAAGALALCACAGVKDDAAESAPDSAAASAAALPGETGGMCAGIAGFACANEAEYCHMTPGECVDIADVAGVCTVKPEMCTMDYRPVCGCDGKTYSNACVAASNGASIAYDGECPAED